MRVIILFIFASFLHFQVVLSKKGIVSNFFANNKFDCPSVGKKIYSVASEIQCTHRCLQNEKCKVFNFRPAKDEKENYEIFTTLNQCSEKIKLEGWKAFTLQHDTDEKSPKGTKVYKSCQDVYHNDPSSATGVYNLESGKHFCYMENDTSSCGGGGWTLALKVDGTKKTFMENSTLWTTKKTYNAERGLESFYQNEAKFPAFDEMSFAKICIGMNVATDVRWLRIPNINKNSLLHLFQLGNEVYTTQGRRFWKTIITNSSLQVNCNREGFNLKDGDSANTMLRIGFIANKENDCNTCDSFIGIGPSNVWPISCGNYSPNEIDTRDRNTPAMCYVLIK